MLFVFILIIEIFSVQLSEAKESRRLIDILLFQMLDKIIVHLGYVVE